MVPWLFGKSPPMQPPPPPAPAPVPLSTQIRQNQRQIDKACRELDRERLKMEMQEKSVKTQIKKLAKEGQVDAARIMAKDLLQSVSMQLSTMRTNEAMAGAMSNVVKIMAKMNASMNLPAMQNVLMQFEMEHGKMEMTQEMMDDAMGDVLAGADEEEQTEEILNQVMDELGLENSTKMNTAAPSSSQPAQFGVAEDPALQARLNALQK